MTTTPRRSRGSHGPVIALLVGIALVVVAACGGAIYLIGSSMAGMVRMIEERQGPREHTDERLRVHLRAPEQGRWELLTGELARSWDWTGVAVLRGSDCSAGLIAEPGSGTVPLDAQLARFYGPQQRMEPGPSISGLGTPTRRVVDPADGRTIAVAFLHELMLYRLVGQEPCLGALTEGLTILPGEVTRGWPGATIADQTRRNHRVLSGTFESAASGLAVDAAQDLSFVLDDVGKINASAELVVLHANGARVSLDPFRRAREEAEPELEGEDVGIEIGIEGSPVRFRRTEATREEVVGYARVGGLELAIVADGPDLTLVRDALVAVAPRIRHLGPAALELLRTALATAPERRAGVGWSLRDGVFREHPAEARAAAALYLPRWTEIVAGRELARRPEGSLVEGQIAAMTHRELGVSARLVVAPATAGSASDAIERVATSMPLEVERLGPIAVGESGRARLELRVGPRSPNPQRMTLVTELRGGHEYTLEAWWSEPGHPDAERFVEALAHGLVLEEPSTEAPAGPARHVTDRLGLVLVAPDADVVEEDLSYDGLVDALVVVSAERELDDLMVIAASDPSTSSALLAAADEIGAERTVAAIWQLPTTPTMLDERPATERSFWDGGEEVRVVTTSIDRTVYVAVARGGPRTDWRSVFALVDLDP